MRIFLGIDIPDTITSKIDEQLANLKKEYPQLSWVPQDNYHITIHFFGEVPDVTAVDKRLAELLYDQEAFHLYALQGDLFIQQRITLYIEFSKDKKLEHLAKIINEDAGKERSAKKFLPHMTIARYKVPSKQQYYLLKKKMEHLQLDFDFPVESIYLYESDLRGPMPVYKKIKEYSLCTPKTK